MTTTKYTITIMVLLLAGCARPYTTAEKVAFGFAIGGQVLDGETSRKCGNARWSDGTYKMYETNIFMDDHPSGDEIWLSRAVVVGIAYGLGEIFPEQRTLFYGVVGGSGFICAYNNDRQFDKYD